MGSFVLSVTERSSGVSALHPFVVTESPVEMEDGPGCVGVQRGEEWSALNKASLYPPQRSLHPNYTPDTSTLPPSPLIPHSARRHALPLAIIQFPALTAALTAALHLYCAPSPRRKAQCHAADGVGFAVDRLSLRTNYY